MYTPALRVNTQTSNAPRKSLCAGSPPWRQPRGKSMVSSVNSHTNATRIGWHLWEIDLRFAHGLPPGWSIWRMIENPMSFGSLIIVEATFGNCPGSTPAVIKLMVRSMVKSCASTPSSFSVHASTRHSHQPAERDQTAVLTSLGLHWSSPESGDLWYKSGGSKETVWSRHAGGRSLAPGRTQTVGVQPEQKMLQGHLPRVIYLQVY